MGGMCSEPEVGVHHRKGGSLAFGAKADACGFNERDDVLILDTGDVGLKHCDDLGASIAVGSVALST